MHDVGYGNFFMINLTVNINHVSTEESATSLSAEESCEEIVSSGI